MGSGIGGGGNKFQKDINEAIQAGLSQQSPGFYNFPMVRPTGFPALPEQQLLKQSYALRGGIPYSFTQMPMMPKQWAPKGGQNGG